MLLNVKKLVTLTFQYISLNMLISGVFIQKNLPKSVFSNLQAFFFRFENSFFRNKCTILIHMKELSIKVINYYY